MRWRRKGTLASGSIRSVLQVVAGTRRAETMRCIPICNRQPLGNSLTAAYGGDKVDFAAFADPFQEAHAGHFTINGDGQV